MDQYTPCCGGYYRTIRDNAWAGILLILFGVITFIKPLIKDKKLFQKPVFRKVLEHAESLWWLLV